ncbi:ATP-binding protein [Thioclava sp. GXIMD4216]|uniref:PAS domain-containing sensor histidine kinase n=1 Tax=Thioclava sp. GXIMD4216 TaxID=3131929 RepID=UPI0030CFE61D
MEHDHTPYDSPAAAPPLAVEEAAWVDVLSAMDKTYANLVDYQAQLEDQNHALEDMRSYLNSIMSSVSDALIVVSRQGRVEETSSSVAQMTGCSAGDLSGLDILDIVAPSSRDHLIAALSECTDRRATVTCELSLSGPEGEILLEMSINARFDERGRLSGHVLTGRPVGELRRAYSELAASHDALKSAQSLLVQNEKLASLGRLLAGVAHELNNPISFVYANTHAMERYATKFETYFNEVQDGASREKLMALREELRLDREVRNLREAIAGARDGAERVRDIVEDLRRLSSDGSGESVAFDLVTVARTAAHWVARGSDREVAIVFDGLAVLQAMGRAGHIQQIIMNLVQNALDAMVAEPAPHLTITASEEAGMARLVICDNGPGISEEVARSMFDPFFTTKEVGQGTGLGLAISHRIATDHGGRLSYRANAAGGACFLLELPQTKQMGSKV